jgi:hypothetical protein
MFLDGNESNSRHSVFSDLILKVHASGNLLLVPLFIIILNVFFFLPIKRFEKSKSLSDHGYRKDPPLLK